MRRRSGNRGSRVWRVGIRLLALVLVLFLLVQGWFLAQVIWLRWNEPATTPVMRAQLERLTRENPRARLSYQWVAYADIAQTLKQAVIASEDARFASHDGVDWEAIERAWEDNRRRGRVVRGGSTITMQLAKNLFLSGEKSYLRKGQELVISFMLEAVLGKRRILELYLNVAEWGNGVFGAQAAARHYYGLDARSLDALQSARLAAMLPRPRHHDLHRESAQLDRRSAMVLRWMSGVALP